MCSVPDCKREWEPFGVETPLLNKRLTFANVHCLSISALKGVGTCGFWQRGATLSRVYTAVSAPELCGFSLSGYSSFKPKMSKKKNKKQKKHVSLISYSKLSIGVGSCPYTSAL